MPSLHKHGVLGLFVSVTNVWRTQRSTHTSREAGIKTEQPVVKKLFTYSRQCICQPLVSSSGLRISVIFTEHQIAVWDAKKHVTSIQGTYNEFIFK